MYEVPGAAFYKLCIEKGHNPVITKAGWTTITAKCQDCHKEYKFIVKRFDSIRI